MGVETNYLETNSKTNPKVSLSPEYPGESKIDVFED